MVSVIAARAQTRTIISTKAMRASRAGRPFSAAGSGFARDSSGCDLILLVIFTAFAAPEGAGFGRPNGQSPARYGDSLLHLPASPAMDAAPGASPHQG